MTDNWCPFCAPLSDRVFYRDALVIGVWDSFPVTLGHALLIPVRHVSTWFEASIEEQNALIRAIDVARQTIESSHGADGYNVGFNNGAAAGQTVFHLHVHVIPRRLGDVPDPRGGVRHVIPDKANYVSDSGLEEHKHARDWVYERALVTGGTVDPLLPQLKSHLALSIAADVAVAFLLRSGVNLLQPHLQDLLDRGGQLRVLTGDYMQATDPDALLRLLDLNGRIECRVFQTASESRPVVFAKSFHPKAYIFEYSDGSGAAFVGSSNLSASALTTGVEWNYRVLESRDRGGWNEIRQAFTDLFASPNVVRLTPEWIASYRQKRDTTLVGLPTEVTPDSPIEIPSPHAVQKEALAALGKTRAFGRIAGLVVLATGLGKTWLSAFDSRAFRRVLFVAHREEILGQALNTYRRIRPHDMLGRYTGREKTVNADVLFASIQTLSRQAHLDRFSKAEFDYIVIDEFHHAEAKTYRRLLNYFTPTFLLGLTATPERTDGADLLSLCDDNLVYRCDLVDGIRRELLCSFRYFGVPDLVDYSNIPWRNRKFDEDKLTKAVATQARAANALDQYRKRAGKRTLAFCVSQRHADFMADYFSGHGVSARAVHAGPTSAPRADSLEALRSGSLAVVCAVDMFNEGIDLPELDTVMMLRPTESRIVWLQQFGRGLRRTGPEKTLNVIDYIGNHRSFLLKPQALFGLPPGDREILNLLEQLDRGTAELPPGCEVTYELEAKDILRSLLRVGGSAVDLLTRRYQDFRDTFGVRPTAVEMFREGYNPRAMRSAFGSWLGFVQAQDGLAEDGRRAFEKARVLLEVLETTPMVKSYKMLVLLAMLNRDQLPGSIGLHDLVAELTSIARRDHQVAADIGDTLRDPAKLEQLLKDNPIEAWVEGKGTGGVSHFSFDRAKFSARLDVSGEITGAFQELVRELVDWRLAEYFSRLSQLSRGEYVLKISHANGKPILFLPDRKLHPGLPYGWTQVRVNEDDLNLNFVMIAVNVANRGDSDANVLPDVLRGWFGSDAGRPGTKHQVFLRQEGPIWVLRPVGTNAVGATPYKAYRRSDIAPLFQLPYSERYWGQGFVRQGNHIFLLVTLDKSGQAAAFQYKDHFVSARTFQWQSQNRTTRESDAGRSIEEHMTRGITVHLFVRQRSKTNEGKGAPFYYCGPVEFVSWSGDKPITVIWELTAPVPEVLWSELMVPHVGSNGR